MSPEKRKRKENCDKNFECSLCKRAFNRKGNLNQHIKQHFVQGKQFKCGQCSSAFKQLHNLKKHTKEFHDPKFRNRFECVFCKQGFARENVFNEHTLSHIEERHYCCNHCDKEYYSNSSLRVHSKIHGGKIYKCQFCKIGFNTEGKLNEHVKFIHDPDTSHTFQCVFCGNKSLDRRRLEQHLRSHTQERPFFCKVCSGEFATRSSLKQHLETHESNREKRFACLLCPKRFWMKSYLKLHIETHTCEKAYKCELCGKSYVSPNVLRKHKALMHGNASSFECGTCKKTFKTSEYLKRHQQTHIKALRCKKCTKTFSRKASPLTHYDHVHTKKKRS